MIAVLAKGVCTITCSTQRRTCIEKDTKRRMRLFTCNPKNEAFAFPTVCRRHFGCERSCVRLAGGAVFLLPTYLYQARKETATVGFSTCVSRRCCRFPRNFDIYDILPATVLFTDETFERFLEFTCFGV